MKYNFNKVRQQFLLLALGWALLPPGVAVGQAARPVPYDSLRRMVAEPGLTDSARVYRGLIACQYLMYTQTDSSRHYARQALAVARRAGFASGVVQAYGGLAGLALYTGDYPQAQHYYQAKLAAARRAGLLHQVGGAYSGLASLATRLNDSTSANRYYELARQAFARCTPPDVQGQILVLNNQAEGYLKHGQVAAAAPLVRQAVALFSPATYPEYRTSVLGLLGQVQAAAGQSDSAQATWLGAARQARAAALGTIEAGNYLALARHLLATGRPAAAAPYARQAVPLLRQANSADLADAWRVLADALAAQSQPEAYAALRRYVGLQDTQLTQANTEAVATAQARFERAEQQDRIQELEQQRKAAQHAQELAALRSQAQLYGLAGLLLMAAVATGGLLWYFRHRQLQREAGLRLRIAHDLQADIGEMLGQLTAQSGLLQAGLASPESQRQQLGQLAQASRAARQQLEDVVWTLSTKHDYLTHLITRVQVLAREVLDPCGVALVLEVPPQGLHRRLPLHLRHHLFFLCKESMLALPPLRPRPTRLRLRLDLADRLLTITMYDDGPARPLSPALLRRVAALHGHAQAGPDTAGHQVVVRVPLPGRWG